MSYGYQFKIARHGVYLMLNGRRFAIYKSAITGQWKFSYCENIWRKRKEPIK